MVVTTSLLLLIKQIGSADSVLIGLTVASARQHIILSPVDNVTVDKTTLNIGKLGFGVSTFRNGADGKSKFSLKMFVFAFAKPHGSN